MKRYIFQLILLLGISNFIIAQNVGISNSATAPRNCAMLDIVASDKGLLIPQVILTNINTYLPLTGTAVAGLLIYNTATAGVSPNNVLPGFYYWDGAKWVAFSGSGGREWSLLGNAGTVSGTNFLGTTDAQALVFKVNNIERARINPTDGEFVVGATTSGLPGDMFCAVTNATLPWGVNGYSSQNGSAVYGAILAGATNFGAVQGEYLGSGAYGAGVKGLYNGTGAGTGFLGTLSKNGVYGNILGSGSYQFGSFGQSDGNFGRTGGVMGVEYFSAAFNARGALGYTSSGFADVAVYGFGQAHTTGVAAGKLMDGGNVFSETNAMIGLAIYGGVMGGWIKGLVYGTNFSGQKYGVYVHGNTITNAKYVQLNNSSSSDVRIASYATTALTNELTSKGKVNIVNGEANVVFDEKLIELCDLSSLVITATPMGNCNGVYIENITRSGFTIKEINNGTHDVVVSFIISGTLSQATEFTEAEILNNVYETNMNGVMYNDNDYSGNALPIWFDGQNVRHDAVPRNGKSEGTEENKKLIRKTQGSINIQPSSTKQTTENK